MKLISTCLVYSFHWPLSSLTAAIVICLNVVVVVVVVVVVDEKVTMMMTMFHSVSNAAIVGWCWCCCWYCSRWEIIVIIDVGVVVGFVVHQLLIWRFSNRPCRFAATNSSDTFQSDAWEISWPIAPSHQQHHSRQQDDFQNCSIQIPTKQTNGIDWEEMYRSKALTWELEMESGLKHSEITLRRVLECKMPMGADIFNKAFLACSKISL